MATQRTQAVSRTTEWSEKKRYKVNDSENYNGNVYQNVTGFNSEPGVGNDWILLSQLGIKDVFAGTNMIIDKTDPLNPIFNASGGTSNLKWNHTYSENNAGYTGSVGRLAVYTIGIPVDVILDENTFIEFDCFTTVEAGAIGSCTTEVHITDSVPTADITTLIAYFNRGGTGLQQSVSRKLTMLDTESFFSLPNNRNIQSDYSAISNSFNRAIISGFSPTKRNITVVLLKTNLADTMKFTDINIKIYQNG